MQCGKIFGGTAMTMRNPEAAGRDAVNFDPELS
jgi:hypothetical protein